MNANHISVWAGLAISLSAPVAQADSLECNGEFITQGMTEAQLLEACGEPASRDGANLVYKIPGSIPVVVTLGDGVVMFIRDAEDDMGGSESPLGDHL